MTENFQGTAEQIKEKLAETGIEYGLSIGRRAPMHRLHVDCIEEIAEAGLKPIMFVGSINGPDSKFYDPIRNPMTLEQQKAQLKLAVPQYYDNSLLITQEDKGDPKPWFDGWLPKLDAIGASGKTITHYRSKASDKPQAGGAIRQLSTYVQHFNDRDIPAWQSFNSNPDDDNVSATDLRTWDLNQLTQEQRDTFATPDYIIRIANEARSQNPDKALLEQHDIPVTVLDLSLSRLRREAGIRTADIIHHAAAKGDVNADTIASAATDILNGLYTKKQPEEAKHTVRAKVASVALNQTVVNFTRNVPNIKAAIDKAVEDGADVLSLQELVLTGYTGDGYFEWIRKQDQQKELIELLEHIAEYAHQKDPNLVISVGFPFFYKDENEPVRINVGTDEKPHKVENPLYNIDNKPFNAVAIIGGGKIQAISAKSIQPGGTAEYEARQFQPWPDHFGVKEVTLYNSQKVPFGKVVVQLGKDKDKSATLYHEICAEAWPGINNDGTVNLREQREGRYLLDVAAKQDISLTINPSASKPEPILEKAGLRQKLATSGSQITKGAYVYTNAVGLEAAPVAFEGGSIYANKGEIIHTGERYNLGDVVYSSATMDLRVPEKSAPDVVIAHEFRDKEKDVKKGGSAPWESIKGNERVYEEDMRNSALWLRDYLKKTGQQGFFISLSGGMDSAFGAVAVIQMIELDIERLIRETGSKEAALVAFLDQFDNDKYNGLLYAAEVKDKLQTQGFDEALKLLKSKMLTCSYFPGENSSQATENAARVLIEGGQLPDGRTVKGIGGTFHNVPVQDIIDSYIEAYAGIDKSGMSADQEKRLRAEVKECVEGKRDTLSDEFSGVIKKRILSWKNKKDDLPLQNLQARVRAPMAWLFGNDEHKIACVTSNWSEAVAGYWTFAGDGHMGSINVLGGIAKSDIRQLLPYLEKKGLNSLEPVESLYYINQNKPSAELRPLVDGKIQQFDEDDMMPYEQLDAIARKMIIGRNSPVDAYKQLWEEQPTYPNGGKLFGSKEELIARIEECCWRWHASQFKRVASVITPYLGQNVDPHTAVRTTILSDGFVTGRAMLKMEYLKDQLGGEKAFEDKFGKPFNKLMIDAKISKDFRRAVMKSSLADMEKAVTAHCNPAPNFDMAM